MVRAGVGAGIFDKLEPEPHKYGPAPQHCSVHCSKFSKFLPKSLCCTGTIYDSVLNTDTA
jgi:hypothetical protein